MSAGEYRLTAVTAKPADDVDGERTIEVCVAVEDVDASRTVPGTARVSFGRAPESRAAVEHACAFVTAAAGSLVGCHGRSLAELDAEIGAVARTRERESPEARGVLGAPEARGVLGAPEASGVLGVSVAVARAIAVADGRPRHRVVPAPGPARLPMPRVDIVRGGRQASNRLDFAAFSILPMAARSFADALRTSVEVYECFATVLSRNRFPVSRDHDGTYVPPLQAPGDVLDLLCDAIVAAGYEPGPRGVAISIAVTATSLALAPGSYRVNGTFFEAAELVEYLAHLVDRYPVTSLEAPLANGDAKGWRLAADRLGDRVQLMAGSTPMSTPMSTGPTGGAEARQGSSPTAVAVEAGRARTVSELVETVGNAHARGARVLVSVRAGGVDVELAAGAAVGTGCEQIAGGPPASGGLSLVYDHLAALDASARAASEVLAYLCGGE